MHSWDYSGPYHGFDGFPVFARDMDMTVNSPTWRLDTEEKMIKIKDHNELFHQPDYQAQFERKKEFENPWPAEKVKEVSDWTKTRGIQGTQLCKAEHQDQSCKGLSASRRGLLRLGL